MKTIRSFLWLLLLPVISIVLINCDDTEVPGIFTAKFEAKVDGQLTKLTPTFVITTYDDTITGQTYNGVSIVAITVSTTYPRIALNLEATTGTKDFKILSRNMGFYNIALTDEGTYVTNNQTGVTGQVSITELDYKKDGIVKGTFNFTGKQIIGSGTVVITEGIFQGKFLM